jgi:hypothetical protein
LLRCDAPLEQLANLNGVYSDRLPNAPLSNPAPNIDARAALSVQRAVGADPKTTSSLPPKRNTTPPNRR